MSTITLTLASTQSNADELPLPPSTPALAKQRGWTSIRIIRGTIALITSSRRAKNRSVLFIVRSMVHLHVQQLHFHGAGRRGSITFPLTKSVGNVNGLKTFKSLRGNGSEDGEARGLLLFQKVLVTEESLQAQKEVHVNEYGVEVMKLKGLWDVHVLGALPLRNLPRLWGNVNSLELPPGVRPVDNAVLVSPADGTILHLVVDDKELYPKTTAGREWVSCRLVLVLSMSSSTSAKKNEDEGDASVVEPNASIQDTLARDVSQVGVSTVKGSTFSLPGKSKHEHRGSSYINNARPGHSLFFFVIYLAPGDYHRFHSPTAWVVKKRMHFGAVSPWMADGGDMDFSGWCPVGATNVGSIVVNFDQNSRTKSLRLGRTTKQCTRLFPLNGQPLTHAQEMGGFKLGSTIVFKLVFEVPDDFEFTMRAGQKVTVGQNMGDVPA
ncbi:hypothetical protein M378DRAFT_28394 [Amanita muscaria Koide BX008]|uniref:Phosphatidylserine decarboxylase n=1 Tax=Amanita muscaria (strain Koide BX008) TaxID=946122 RepID=A0A0C2WHN2_AMAMK|nr:hypothetical protein M378DRAFT_28394 [Amanita muscaria Koide BX008]